MRQLAARTGPAAQNPQTYRSSTMNADDYGTYRPGWPGVVFQGSDEGITARVRRHGGELPSTPGNWGAATCRGPTAAADTRCRPRG